MTVSEKSSYNEELFETKVIETIKTRVQKPCSGKHAFYEIMWEK
jgi:hypothetical protein